MNQDLPSALDLESIRQCLRFVLDSRILQGEFETRLGVEEADVMALLYDWPPSAVEKIGPTGRLAISNSLNEVCNGLSISDVEWSKWFTVSRDRVAATLRSWSESLS